MDFEATINQQIKEAMKARQGDRLEAVRAIKAAILLEKTSGAEPSQAGYLKMLQKMAKQRDDSAEIYRQQNRPELAAKEEYEAGVIREFLPQPMTEAEVADLARRAVAQTGAQGMKDMGRAMSHATAEAAGRADAKLLAAAVKAALQ